MPDIKELIHASLNRLGKKDLALDTIVYNTIIAVFLKEKNIDISSFLISAKYKEGNVYVKLSKKILAEELINLENKIVPQLEDKFNNLGVKYKKLNLFFK